MMAREGRLAEQGLSQVPQQPPQHQVCQHGAVVESAFSQGKAGVDRKGRSMHACKGVVADALWGAWLTFVAVAHSCTLMHSYRRSLTTGVAEGGQVQDPPDSHLTQQPSRRAIPANHNVKAHPQTCRPIRIAVCSRQLLMHIESGILYCHEGYCLTPGAKPRQVHGTVNARYLHQTTRRSC